MDNQEHGSSTEREFAGSRLYVDALCVRSAARIATMTSTPDGGRVLCLSGHGRKGHKQGGYLDPKTQGVRMRVLDLDDGKSNLTRLCPRLRLQLVRI